MNQLTDLFGEMNKIYSPDMSKADSLLADTEKLSKNIDLILAENAKLRNLNARLQEENRNLWHQLNEGGQDIFNEDQPE